MAPVVRIEPNDNQALLMFDNAHKDLEDNGWLTFVEDNGWLTFVEEVPWTLLFFSRKVTSCDRGMPISALKP
jgi:hypothetical protein